MDRINPRNLFVKKSELLNAVLKKPDLCVLSWEVMCRYVAFWTMFVCIIVHGWMSLVSKRATQVIFNNCFRYSFSYILTLLFSASVLWIGTMYMADSMSVVCSISYSGYLILLYEIVRLVLWIAFPFTSNILFSAFVLSAAVLLYLNFLNIFNFYSVSTPRPLHL